MENMQKDSETISLKKIIVDYLYHEEIRVTENTGKRNR